MLPYKSCKILPWIFNGDLRFELDHELEGHFMAKVIFSNGNPTFYRRFEKSENIYIQIWLNQLENFSHFKVKNQKFSVSGVWGNYKRNVNHEFDLDYYFEGNLKVIFMIRNSLVITEVPLLICFDRLPTISLLNF